MKQSGWRSPCLMLLFCVATATTSPAQITFTTLASFDDGFYPQMVLTQGIDGNFYGTTPFGGGGAGCRGCGTVFQMTPAGALTTLYAFCPQAYCLDGSYPAGALAQASNGDLYGTTAQGGGSTECDEGCGTVFKITEAGKLTTLYSFCATAGCVDGKQPNGGLVRGTNGTFYGTTAFGGLNAKGTIFEISPAGKLTTLFSVDGTDGDEPEGTLVQARNGNFYGETEYGGASYNSGTLFEMTRGGVLTTLFTFGTGGDFPVGGLIQARNTDFYGVTADGGSNSNPNYCLTGCGTIFKTTPAGTLTTLYDFCAKADCADGMTPNGPLVQATDGNFYGTTYGYPANQGTVFEITPEGKLSTLYSFCPSNACPVAYLPAAGLLQATDGSFYGTTYYGGSGQEGSIFRLSTGLAPFVSFVENTAKIGQEFDIMGQELTGTTEVLINGIPTSFTDKSDTLLIATVPAGATTGYVTVNIASGTLTSNVPLYVIP
jgi:uncharacterized repeat protein (TIGR03803 family)